MARKPAIPARRAVSARRSGEMRGRLPGGDEPQGERASQQIVGGQSQCDEESETTEGCHYDYDSTVILARRRGGSENPNEVILNP